MKMLIPAALATAVALTGCMQTAEESASHRADAERRLAKELDGFVAVGEPTDCISDFGVDGPIAVDENTVLFKQVGRRIYRNELEGTCPSLYNGGPVTFVIERHGSQICRHDQFRTLESGSNIPSGFCQLGKFTRYDRKP